MYLPPCIVLSLKLSVVSPAIYVLSLEPSVASPAMYLPVAEALRLCPGMDRPISGALRLCPIMGGPISDSRRCMFWHHRSSSQHHRSMAPLDRSIPGISGLARGQTSPSRGCRSSLRRTAPCDHPGRRRLQAGGKRLAGRIYRLFPGCIPTACRARRTRATLDPASKMCRSRGHGRRFAG